MKKALLYIFYSFLLFASFFLGSKFFNYYSLVNKKNEAVNNNPHKPDSTQVVDNVFNDTSNVNLSDKKLLKEPLYTQGALPNFIYAASVTKPTVVNVTVSYEPKVSENKQYHSPLEDLLKEFFGGDAFKNYSKKYGQKQAPSYVNRGSGVIVSNDGYVITNVHVISGADSVEVTLDNNKKYKADIVGWDNDTDLALLKIDAKDLAYLRFGNSDDLNVGEWVLAVGNPFGLTSTVTQGIVSAKARNLDAIPSDSLIKLNSFIQTDAAINPGNSGGPLVNLKGELVGINTIIATPTGAFAGYAFAIPSIIVKKVFDDLKTYGYVDRAMLGVIMISVDKALNNVHQQNDKYDIKGIKSYLENNNILSGAYICDFNKNSFGYKAGLRKGDVITAVNDIEVKNVYQLQEIMSRFNSGDKVSITFYRNKKKSSLWVTLGSLANDKLKVVKVKNQVHLEGGVFEDLDEKMKVKLNLDGGVCLKQLSKGKLQDSGIKVGYIITKVNKKQVISLDGFLKYMRESDEGPVFLEGLTNEGKDFYCVFNAK